jgi:hypothetical protein
VKWAQGSRLSFNQSGKWGIMRLVVSIILFNGCCGLIVVRQYQNESKPGQTQGCFDTRLSNDCATTVGFGFVKKITRYRNDGKENRILLIDTLTSRNSYGITE